MPVVVVNWAQPGKNHDPDKVSVETATDLTGVESATYQSLAPATEIDNIMKRFHATGEMPRARKMAEYGDFDDSLDLQGMLEQMKIGERAFRQVPSSIRAMFDNDPGEFLQWIHDEDNHAEAIELGLLPKPVAPPVVAATAATVPVTAAAAPPVAPAAPASK